MRPLQFVLNAATRVISRHLLGEKTDKAADDSHTANDFVNLFADMVEAVLLSTSSVPFPDIPYTATYVFDSFLMLTPEQVEEMIDTAQRKTCQIDPARRGS